MVPSARERRLDTLIASLVPAFLGSDLTFVSAFLRTYRSFTTTQRVLDTLCARYGCIFPNSEGDGGPVDQVKGAIYSILGMWLDQHHEDFFQPPEFPCLRLLLAYIQLKFPRSSLEHQVHLLLSGLTDLESPEAEMEGPDEDQETTQEVTPTSSVVPSTEPEASGGLASPEEEEAKREHTPYAIPGMSGGSASPEGVRIDIPWHPGLPLCQPQTMSPFLSTVVQLCRLIASLTLVFLILQAPCLAGLFSSSPPLIRWTP
ncbi:Ral guanine nucleotide dissociation stimulator [Pteropus alecto]|uniref:Ral guanine nucleotide dissociation stimulator n=1 Tax=Pteropus alecto TaxID=9402 RepID=L5KV77_PTEAL|nr:Ral guanine nucleotide dissociation stimulator [Pteropus alecto]